MVQGENQSDQPNTVNPDGKYFTTELADQAGLPQHRYPLTPKEIDIAEEALANELKNLTLDEHEKLLFDIHGLPSSSNSDPNDMASLIKQVFVEIRKLDCDKSAYEKATYYCSEWKESEQDIKMFLRCNDFDPVAAAESTIEFFRSKIELFGEGEILGRGIVRSDLTPAEVKFLEAGMIQILPSRDASGRTIVWLAGAFRRALPVKSLCRVLWYFYSNICCDEETQKNGFVEINHCMGEYGQKQLGPDHSWLRQLNKQKLIRPPIKLVAQHHCMEKRSIGARAIEAGTRLFMDREGRHKMRFHYGDTETVLFHLQTFGILTDDLPINEAETIELGWHKQWMKSVLAREQAGNCCGEAAPTACILPRRFDVLFGKKHGNRVHTGNLRAIHLVEMHFEQYEQASKTEKTAIAERVMTIIFESQGRFLTWKNEAWEETDFETAREKISHFFRHQRTKRKNTSLKSTASETSSVPSSVRDENCSNKRAATVSPGPVESSDAINVS